MSLTRRAALRLSGAALPLAAAPLLAQSAASEGVVPRLQFLPFEDALRRVFAAAHLKGNSDKPICQRIDVLSNPVLASGIQGCCNDRTFAGYTMGSLRIVRIGSEGRAFGCGLRLLVATVDVMLLLGERCDAVREVDFRRLPQSPMVG